LGQLPCPESGTFLDFLRKAPPVGYDELSDKIDHVERQVKMLELEWESTYNKLRSILARLNKRDERAAPEESSEPAGDSIDRIIALRRGRR